VTGTGGDFGNFGLPLTVSGTSPLNMGTAGTYLDPTSVIADPLVNIVAPTTTGLTNQDATTACTEAVGQTTCPDISGNAVMCPAAGPTGIANPYNCTVLWPGIYNNSLQSIKGSKLGYVIFTPGIYYIQSGGVSFDANSTGQTQIFPTTQGVYPTCNHPDAKTGCGVLFYLSQNGGSFNVSANASNLFLLGSDPVGTYQKIVIFVDHGAPAQTHTLGGGGTWNVTGTVYLTNTVPTILNSAGQAQFQSFGFQGNSASGTVNGEIIVDSLNLGGTPNITMNLDPATVQIRQIALVR
jgi:hypothetical protein